MNQKWIVFGIIWFLIALLGASTIRAAENEPENPDCTAGTEHCEQNSLDTTNNTTTNNTNVNTNTNNNTSTSTATNTNNNTNTTTTTGTNTNTNTNTSTNSNTNVNTSTATTTATSTNANTNTNTNVNTSTSNSTVNSTVNQSVTNTSTTDNTNTNVNTSTSTSDNTNTNVNQSTSESNVTTDNTNTNVNQTTTDNTNRNINESSSTQRIEQDIKTEAPPASAIAPSIMSYSQDLCTTGRSGAFQGQVFGFSTGRTIRDENCERLKLSKYIYDMGMKVAAVSILCQDQRVFAAMEMAGTPCPYMGKIGKEASTGWKENRTDRPDYDMKRKQFIKACKDTKHVQGKLDGLRKSKFSCKKEWNDAG
jgi:DNA polymerase III alpha subunit (gram-positive type)